MINLIVSILIYINLVGDIFTVYLLFRVAYILFDKIINHIDEIIGKGLPYKEVFKKISKKSWRILEYSSYIEIILALLLIIFNLKGEGVHLIAISGAVKYIISQIALKIKKEEEQGNKIDT